VDPVDVELGLDELEARASALVRGWLHGHWRAHRDGQGGGGLWPAELSGAPLIARLDRWRGAGGAAGRRAEMLWRMVVRGTVERDPGVRQAAAVAGEAGLRALLAARERAARALGWPGFLPLAHALEELEAEANQVVGGPSAAPDQAPDAPVAPLVDTGRRRLAELGLPVDRARIDVGGTVGRCYPLAPPHEVCVVVPATARPRLVFHELGHAVYALGLAAGLPWSLARAPARCLEEAVAELVADLADPDDPSQRDLRQRRRLGWRRARAGLEAAAYRDPDADLERRLRDLVDEHVAAPPPGPWHALDHLRVDPGAQASYLAAEHVRAALAARLDWPSVPAARRLSALLRDGATHPWRTLLAGI